MSGSIKQRLSGVTTPETDRELRALLNAILVDLAALRTIINAHVHSGVTAGGANTGALVTAAGALTLLA